MKISLCGQAILFELTVGHVSGSNYREFSPIQMHATLPGPINDFELSGGSNYASPN